MSLSLKKVARRAKSNMLGLRVLIEPLLSYSLLGKFLTLSLKKLLKSFQSNALVQPG